jgi:hypothetical protein
VVKVLLDQISVNINERSPSGTSPLQVALIMHHLLLHIYFFCRLEDWKSTIEARKIGLR